MKINFPLFSILTVNFISALGFSITLPFLVVLNERFGGNAFVYGLLGAIYPIFQFIGAPLMGAWSDKYGRRPLLILSQIGTLIGWLIFLLALFIPITTLYKVDSALLGNFVITVPLVILFVSRALDGLTGGNISIAQAYLADITTEKERSKGYGTLAVASNIGFVIGPAFSGILISTSYGEKLPVLLAALISLTSLIFTFIFLPESKSHKKVLQPVTSFLQLLKKWDISYMLLMYFVIFLGFNIFYTAFPLHAIKTLGWSIGKMGFYFSFLSILMALVQGPILGLMSKKYSDSTLSLMGAFLLGTNFILVSFPHDVYLYAGAVLFAFGNGLMWPSILSLVSKVAGHEHQGRVQGMSTGIASIASVIGLIGGGFLYVGLSGYTFLISSGLMYLVFVLSIHLFSIEKRYANKKPLNPLSLGRIDQSK